MTAITTPTVPPKRRRFKRAHVIEAALLVVLLIAVPLAWFLWPRDQPEPYDTAAVQRGDLTRTVSASGTLQALVTTNVGSQLSGQIRTVLVDFNDRVRRGQVLAELDPSTFDSRVRQASADVAASSAVANQQEAELRQAQADAELSRVQLDRQNRLRAQGFAAPAAVDTARAQYSRSQAAVAASRASIRAQQARVGQSQAALRSNQVDLGRTQIVSPIDGVVIDRQVQPGQTVAAGLQVATLFTIAQDLGLLEVRILVDEADIGQVRVGQPVRFTVDAFPDDTYTGRVTQVRQQPLTENNVVAYVVLAEAANENGRLLPGMTANADIVVEELNDVLKVPSSALRFTPANAQPQARGGGGASPFRPGATAGGRRGGGAGGQGHGGGQGGGGLRMFEDLRLDAGQRTRVQAIMRETRQTMQAGDPQARRGAMAAAMEQIAPILRPDQRAAFEAIRARAAAGGSGRGGRNGGGGAQRGTVWVLREGEPQPVRVRVGGTDGSFTQIMTRDLQPGDEVIVGGGPRPPAQLPQGRGGPGGGGGRSGVGIRGL